MKTLDLQVVIYREGRHYVAQCLNVDVSSFGSTEEKALANVKEALELFFEDTDAPQIIKVEAPELKQVTLQSA